LAFGAWSGVRIDHPDALGAEDCVEAVAELRVAVVDQGARPLAVVVEVHQQVACLLGHPRRMRLGRTSDELAPARPIETKNSTYKRRSRRVSTVNNSQARIVFPVGAGTIASWRRRAPVSARGWHGRARSAPASPKP
jgi:hypothetical protein